jgi:hypothetical protein|tara:strand:- start:909 stop:1157 length:249 start_codon:yes stop_codon:yes gene_type:complete
LKYFISFLIFIFIILNTTAISIAKQPRAKFYDFNEQLIDGEIKKPTTLYTDARDKVRFDRLLRLKKSFLPELFDTAKESVFK